MANDNAVQGVGLVLGTLSIAVFLLMKVADQEKWKPSSLIRVHTMDQHERRGKFVAVFTWNHIHHSGRMFDGVIPK
jgi:hypothetical protein